jgi:predicted transcriptional regulator of viral defense system
MQNKEYYIGYASAMQIHGIKIQPGNTESGNTESEVKEYVVTRKQTKPAIRSFGGNTYQFIQQDESRFFGFSSIWINQLEKAMVSDLEKTIVDIATKPQYAGGIIEVGNAIFQTKIRTDFDKLFYYFARNRNKSAKKRFLFLTELLGLEWTAEHERMMEELGPGISILDPSAPDQGSKRSKFGLKINVDPIQIKNKVLHHSE